MRLQHLIDVAHRMLASRTAHEVLVYGFFVLLSAAAWFMQVLHDTYEVDLPLPLELCDVPDGVIITDSLPHEILVKVNDKGTTLMGYAWDADKALKVSFADYKTQQPIGNVRIMQADIQKRLQAFLLPSTNIVRIINDTIGFSYNRGVSRRLPVRINGNIETQQHMYIHSVVILPDSVTVYAPRVMLDTMTFAPTVPISLQALHSDTQFSARMASPSLTKCTPDTVQVRVHVDSYTEKTVEVPIMGINFPAGKKLRTFPSKVGVTFKVGMENYNAVTADQFVIAVSYEELLLSGRCRLRLKSTPAGVSAARLSMTEVDFLIEQTAF